MSLDHSTEQIAHFIGSFHLDIDALRLRTDYEAFKVAQNAEAEPPPETEHKPMRSPPYEMKGFEPGLTYVAPADAAPPQEVPLVEHGPEEPVPLEPALVEEGPAPDQLALVDAPVGGSGVTLMIPPPPNSILTVTTQIAVVSDSDVLDFGAPDAFIAPELQFAQLTTLVATATALGAGVGETLLPSATPTLAQAETMAGEMLATGQHPAAPGVTETVLHGPEAETLVIDGEAASDMPLFIDLLPALLKPEEAPEEEALDPRLDPNPDAPDPFGVDPGHEVVTGGNLAINEALITLRWVDAPVIAVGGSVMDLSSISQTNVMVSTALPGATLAPSVAMNAASIGTVSSQTGTAAPVSQDQPEGWNVVTIEGDLTAVNWIQQYVFLTDMDCAEVIFTGAATYIGMGENVVSNLTSLTELGYHYDLIVVGGDMLTLNTITQTNVLLDADVVTGAPVGTVQGQENVQLNKAEISTVGIDTVEKMTDELQATMQALETGGFGLPPEILADPHFAGLDTINVLYITGDLIKMNVIDQVNVIGDSDQVHMALDDVAALEGALVTVTTGANAQLNSAQVVDDGIDSVVMAMGEAYSDALIHQAGLIDLDAPPDGVAMSAMVNEAVAFLAEGMIDSFDEPEFAPIPALPDHPGYADVMQTALA